MRTTVALALVALSWCSAPSLSDAEDAMDRTPIDEANAKLIAFQKQGNAAGMRDMYTENAVLLPGGGKSLRGHDAIEAFWEKQLGSDGVEDVRLRTEELVSLGGDLAYEIGSYTTTPKDAEPMSGHYLVIWKREDGAWKLHADIFNKAE